MHLAELAATSRLVAATRSRIAKRDAIAHLLRSARPEEAPVVVAYLSGELPQGSIGVGWRSLADLPGPSDEPSLSLAEVDAALTRVAEASGAGSRTLRRDELVRLFGRAGAEEQALLRALLTGELRQGALEGVMTEAVAAAAGVPPAAVRRAAMVTGDLGRVAATALAERGAGLERYRLRVLQPLQPMLAQSAADVAAALARTGEAAVEWKLDGARLQVHLDGTEVRAFTRNLADVTERVPEVVDALRAASAARAIVDGEVIALRPGGRPHPFQVTMSRFGSSRAIAALRADVPLSLFLFDCLHLDGDDLIDRPASKRIAALESAFPRDLMLPRRITSEVDEAEAVLAEALAHGHEGVMVKALGAPYEAGRRGSAWIKVKRAHTLDLVVLAAEWGHGRRRGWLSNLHLGARDALGGFVMLGKTFKGMTDEMLAWQTKRLLEIETARRGITVEVRPEVVVEVAFDGIQASPRYPGGLALRFARIKGYRPDKRPEEADTIETVRAIYAGGGGPRATI